MYARVHTTCALDERTLFPSFLLANFRFIHSFLCVFCLNDICVISTSPVKLLDFNSWIKYLDHYMLINRFSSCQNIELLHSYTLYNAICDPGIHFAAKLEC